MDQQPHQHTTPNELPKPTSDDRIFQTFIPTKNAKALTSYYLGVFGFIPFMLPLSIAAVVTGIMGMKQYNKVPTPGAKGHAIAGIVMGAIQIAFFIIIATYVGISVLRVSGDLND